MAASEERIQRVGLNFVIRAMLDEMEALRPGARAAVAAKISAVAAELRKHETEENLGDADKVEKAATSYI